MSAGGMESGWYYAERGGPQGQQVGPVSWQDLVSYARGGAFGPDDVVWHEQLGDWRPASQVPGLVRRVLRRRPCRGRTGGPRPAYAAPAGYAMAPAGKKSKLLYWLLPLIAVIIVGAGLGAYFGFFYNDADDEFAQQRGGDPARALRSGGSGLVRR